MRKETAFTLSGSVDDYPGTPVTFPHPIRKLTLIVTDLPTDAQAEVDVLLADGTTWKGPMATATAVGIYEVADFTESEVEVRVRVKDGGTSGTARVIAVATRDRRV